MYGEGGGGANTAVVGVKDRHATSVRQVTRDEMGLGPTESDTVTQLVLTELPVRQERILWDGAESYRNSVPLPDSSGTSGPRTISGSPSAHTLALVVALEKARHVTT